jgi:S-adenosyl methyltransferase
VAGRGIWQFIDVGAGLPTALNTHDIAQEVSSLARVAYVDNDPMVISHAAACSPRALGLLPCPPTCANRSAFSPIRG